MYIRKALGERQNHLKHDQIHIKNHTNSLAWNARWSSYTVPTVNVKVLVITEDPEERQVLNELMSEDEIWQHMQN